VLGCRRFLTIVNIYMNTVIKFPTPESTIVTSDNKIIRKGVAWFLIPTAPRDCEKVVLFLNGKTYRPMTDFEVKLRAELVRMEVSGLAPMIEVPEFSTTHWLQSEDLFPGMMPDYVLRLAKDGYDRIFIVRDRDHFLGSLSLARGRGNEPIWVQRRRDLVSPKRRKINK
jgi:hypothetical protein